MLRALLILFLLMASPAMAQETQPLINQALDKPANLELNDTLQSVLEKIERETSVPIDIDPQVWQLLPWGRKTTVTATLSNQTVRQAMSALLARLGLEMRLGEQSIRIIPSAALARVGRRVTGAELESLQSLSLLNLVRPMGPTTLRELATEVDAALVGKLYLRVRLENADDALTINLPRDPSLAEALNCLHDQTDLTWYVWADGLVISNKTVLWNRLLDRPITRRWTDVPIDQMLLELSERSGVQITIPPGLLARIPLAAQKVTLSLDNNPPRQAYEVLSGRTGLAYEVTLTGVALSLPDSPTTRPTTAESESTAPPAVSPLRTATQRDSQSDDEG